MNVQIFDVEHGFSLDYRVKPDKRDVVSKLKKAAQGVAHIYGYESPTPSIDDLVLWIFQRALEGFKSDRPGGLQNIQLDFASLRNDRRSQEAMSTLAKRAAGDLDYKSKIEDASFRDLIGVDLFEETDRIIKAQKARGVDLESSGIVHKVRSLVPVIVPSCCIAARWAS